MSDIQKLTETGASVIKELSHAHHAHINAILALAKAEQNLTLAGAQAEIRAIVGAGGEKALGTNADARKRALIIALGADKAYQDIRTKTEQALCNAKLAQAEVAALGDTLGLLKVLLYAGASHDSTWE